MKILIFHNLMKYIKKKIVKDHFNILVKFYIIREISIPIKLIFLNKVLKFKKHIKIIQIIKMRIYQFMNLHLKNLQIKLLNKNLNY